MPVTPESVAKYLNQLQAVRPITSRKMFGGIGVYCDGIFFSVIDDDRLYFKVDGSNLPAFDEHQAEQWIIQGDPPSPMPYREVPAAILSDPEKLGNWIDAAVAVAVNKKKPKSKAKS